MKNKNFLIMLLAVVVILAGFLIVNFGVFTRNEEGVVNNEIGELCVDDGGIWLTDFDECEGLSQEWCDSKGGNFYECESACRHDSSAKVCIEMCIPVCKFGEDVWVGGDRDEGGCLIGAGYSWCEPKQKCLRVWEEPCTDEDLVRNYLSENLSTLSPEPEVLGGKFFVTKLEFINENKAIVEYEDGHNMYRAEFEYEIEGEEIKPVSFELKEEK